MSEVTIETDTGPQSWKVEVAQSPQEIEAGLRYHTKLEPKTGMLFVFDDDRYRQFNTVDMNFAIDMIFMDCEGYVVHIVKNAKPGLKAIMCMEAVRYVLEIPAGEASEYKIRLLNKATISNRN